MLGLYSILALDAPSALARSEDTDWVRIVFFGIMALIWVISAIAKSASKQPKKQAWTDDMAGRDPWSSEPNVTPQAAPPPVPQQYVQSESYVQPVQPQQTQWPAAWVGQAAPPPLPQQAAPSFGHAMTPPLHAQKAQARDGFASTPPRPQQGKKKQPKQKRKVQTPPLPVLEEVESAPSRRIVTEVVRPVAAATPATPSLDAAALKRWLTPEVMHQQFILTELFDRPPSDR